MTSIDPTHRITIFADILLPLPLPQLFTYRVPVELNDFVTKGSRVIVPFGRQKILTGIVMKIHHTPPKKYEAKYLLDLLDEHPVMLDVQIGFLLWLGEYYMATAGEVLAAALPSGLKISSESRVQLHPDFNAGEGFYEFNDSEKLLLDKLSDTPSLSYAAAGEVTGLKNIYKLLHSLVRKDAIILFDQIIDKYRPKSEKRIRLNSDLLDNKSALELLFEKLASAPKQEAALLVYLQQIPVYEKKELNENGIKKSFFKRHNISSSIIKTLVGKNIFEEFERTISRFPKFDTDPEVIHLSPLQTQIRDEILHSFESNPVTLLHGVTGSGKTAIYIDLIQQAMDSDTQVLYLLPEIALTTQIVSRLRKVFGDAVGVYHSRFSDNERVEVWKGVLDGRFNLVIGARSSLFLPFDNLGLVIIDEEHEQSYKQFDPAPRYNARDAGIMLASRHHAHTLLGTATPSLESNYQAKKGKYGLVRLDQRYGASLLPDIQFVDLVKDRNRKSNKLSFTSVLFTTIEEAIDKNEQVIIFQNRRGYSPFISCRTCGWIPTCNQCAVSLTYHQFGETLVCHYCGYKEPVPAVCEACGSREIETIGTGTERLEEELTLLFPKAKIQRMDLDTTRGKYGYEKILKRFEEGETDILVGTQMVSKGLDFDRVSVVGITDLDRMLHFPNFRSTERAFQMALQVSGRAGRKDIHGKVIIQTRDMTHNLIPYIKEQKYHQFFEQEIRERQLHHYPPFTRLINIHLKHHDKNIVTEAGIMLAGRLKNYLGNRILGPQEPVINRIRNEFLNDILIKLERNRGDLPEIKIKIREISNDLRSQKIFRQLKIVFDVDPY